MALVMPVWAEGIAVSNAHLELSEDQYRLSADFDVALTPALEDALNRGVPLYFVTEVDIARSRWYWFDQKVATKSRTLRVSYDALLQRYRIQAGALRQNTASLDEVKRLLSRVRGLEVADKDALKRGEKYVGFLRMRLDTTQLPKPLQLESLVSRDWALDSEWQRFAVTP